MLRTIDFDSIWLKSWMSLMRNSIKFVQLNATLKICYPRSSRWTIGFKISREAMIPFKGFLNSCAA